MLDIPEIKKIIPHRYPFLLIDKILKLNINKNIIALKNVTINEEFFNGHFPQKPVMPGVLIIEAMAQTAAVFALKSTGEENVNKLIYFISIEKAHFRKPILPGDSIFIHVDKVQERKNVWKMSGKAEVDNTKVADAIFSAMLVEEQIAMIYEISSIQNSLKVHLGDGVGLYCTIDKILNQVRESSCIRTFVSKVRHILERVHVYLLLYLSDILLEI